MKVNLSTQIELETRVMLEAYCDKSSESIASVVNRALEKELTIMEKGSKK